METGERPGTPKAAGVGIDVIRAIGQAAAVVAAGVGVVYAVGGLVIWLRLMLVSRPQLAVVSELPREVVSALGLVVVVLALAVGAIYAVWRLVWRPGQEDPPQLGEGIRKTLRGARRLVAIVGLLFAAPTVLILVVARIRDDETLGIGRPWGLLVAVTTVLLLAFGWGLFAVRLRERLGEGYWIRADKEAKKRRLEAARRKADRAREDADGARVAADRADETAKDANVAAQSAREAAEGAADDSEEAAKQREEEERAQETEDRAKRDEDRAQRAAAQLSQVEANVRELEGNLREMEERGGRTKPPDPDTKALAKERYNTTGAIVISALLWAAVWVPPFIAAAASLPLAKARACAAGASLDGEFIGETGERIFLTDAAADRIVSLPLQDLSRVYIGDKARSDDATCPAVSTTP
jgi:hypothetical protein